jgi:hypothetical protein
VVELILWLQVSPRTGVESVRTHFIGYSERLEGAVNAAERRPRR